MCLLGVSCLERKGYEIIDSEWGSEEDKVIGVVAKDNDILVLLMLKKKEFDNDGLDNPDHLSRTELEIKAAKWLSSDFNTVLRHQIAHISNKG